jgi:hypothetical protein
MIPFDVYVFAVLGLALASPAQKRQDLPMDSYNNLPILPDVVAPVGDAVPQTTSYNPTSVASVAAAVATNPLNPDIVTIVKRSTNCSARSYNGPKATLPADNADSFRNYAPFAAAATAAAQISLIPNGYALVPGFINLKSSLEDSHYLTYTTKDLDGGKPDVCASKCNRMPGCNAFNICTQICILVNDTEANTKARL